MRTAGKRALALAVLLAAGVVPARAQDTTGSAAKPPRAMFTEEQATRGEAVYRSSCTSCHSPSAYTGESFEKSWLGRTVFALFDLIRTTMPEDNPGSLRRDEYAAVVAYLLKLNGFPAGSHALPSEDEPLRQLRIERGPSSDQKIPVEKAPVRPHRRR